MSICFTGTGCLFNRLGIIGGILTDTNNFQNLLVLDNTNLLAQYAGGSDAESLVDGVTNAVVSAQIGAEAYVRFLSALASNTTSAATINQMVAKSFPLASNNNLNASLLQVISQMNTASQNVLKMTVGCLNSANAGNQGNGVLVSTSMRSDGRTQECQFAECVLLNCTSDSTGSATAGEESFSVAGRQAVSDQLSNTWPGGSGQSTSLTGISPTNSISTNGDFENWVGSVPTGWTVNAGGTQIQKSTAQFYTGVASLEFAGDGVTLQSLQTPVVVTNYSIYAVSMWVKVSAVPSLGTLRVSLVDENGTVLVNGQSVQQSFTYALSNASSSVWTNVSGVFETPYILPTTTNLKLDMTVAEDNSKNLFIDRCCLTNMTQLYPGGPSFALFSGSQNFYINDGFTASATNSYGLSGTLATWQILGQRLFNFNNLTDPFGLPLLWPSVSGSPTISDSLISDLT